MGAENDQAKEKVELPKIGDVFDIYYNENNINNVKGLKVRSVIDGSQIVIFSKRTGYDIWDYHTWALWVSKGHIVFKGEKCDVDGFDLVTEAIRTERAYQERGKDDDDSHIVDDFNMGSALTAMRHILKKADESWYGENKPYTSTMEYLRKIGGVIYQMGEKYGIKNRE